MATIPPGRVWFFGVACLIGQGVECPMGQGAECPMGQWVEWPVGQEVEPMQQWVPTFVFSLVWMLPVQIC